MCIKIDGLIEGQVKVNDWNIAPVHEFTPHEDRGLIRPASSTIGILVTLLQPKWLMLIPKSDLFGAVTITCCLMLLIN